MDFRICEIPGIDDSAVAVATHIDERGADKSNINIDYISLGLFSDSYEVKKPKTVSYQKIYLYI